MMCPPESNDELHVHLDALSLPLDEFVCKNI